MLIGMKTIWLPQQASLESYFRVTEGEEKKNRAALIQK